MGNWIIGIVTGLISGTISGLLVTVYFRQKDHKKAKKEEFIESLNLCYETCRAIERELELITDTGEKATELLRMIAQVSIFPKPNTGISAIDEKIRILQIDFCNYLNQLEHAVKEDEACLKDMQNKAILMAIRVLDIKQLYKQKCVNK